MQLPNKLYSYSDSTLALVPVVLKVIEEQPLPAYELFNRVKPLMKDTTDFLSVMDCLYALRAVDINDEGEVRLCLQK